MTFKPICGMPGYYEWNSSSLTRQEFLQGIESLKLKFPKGSEMYDALNLGKYPSPDESSFHIHKPL